MAYRSESTVNNIRTLHITLVITHACTFTFSGHFLLVWTNYWDLVQVKAVSWSVLDIEARAALSNAIFVWSFRAFFDIHVWMPALESSNSFTFSLVPFFGAFVSVQTQKQRVTCTWSHSASCGRTKYFVNVWVPFWWGSKLKNSVSRASPHPMRYWPA